MKTSLILNKNINKDDRRNLFIWGVLHLLTDSKQDDSQLDSMIVLLFFVCFSRDYSAIVIK